MISLSHISNNSLLQGVSKVTKSYQNSFNIPSVLHIFQILIYRKYCFKKIFKQHQMMLPGRKDYLLKS